jgi:hypothetical protein
VRSKQDRAPVDTNRLAIVFAPSDHVNRDIYNHAGRLEMDEWMGDPQYEFDEDYSELKRFSHEYFRKYQQRNDINAFIRILSVYDYTFFEQIRQLVPGRADLIAGILIEPNVLERSKVRMTRRPTVENLTYEKELPTLAPTASSEELSYDAVVSASLALEIEHTYYTASVSTLPELTTEYTTYSGSILDPLSVTAETFSHFETASQSTGLYGVLSGIDPYTGSLGETCSYVEDEHRRSCCYKRVIYHYSASGEFQTRYERQWYTAVSMSYKMHYSKSLECWNYQIQECSTRNNGRFRGSQLTGADFNVDSSDTVDGGPVVQVWESNPNTLFIGDNPEGGTLRVE